MTKQYTSDFYLKRQQQAKISAEIVLSLLFSKIRPDSVIDFGCATGSWLAECKSLGVKIVLGLDGSWVDQKLLEINGEEFKEFDLGSMRYIPKRKYDLSLCIEVAEHIPEDMAKILIESITEASDVVLFSAAVCGQGGTGHVNEQPQHFWECQFSKQGYICVDLIRPKIWEHEAVNVIYKQNMLLYVRKSIYDNLNLDVGVISTPFDLDRIHPDLFFMRSGSLPASRWGRIIKGLKLIVRGIGFSR